MTSLNLTPEFINNTTSSILANPQNRYNGRVNIVEPLNPNIQFEMQERISLKNKTTSYCEALTGNFEYNVLGQVFFSEKNIQIIQNGLRAGVYERSGNKFVIAPQNIDNMKVIMRSIYLQYAIHTPDNITDQIVKLNKMVLDYCIPTVYAEGVGYMKYLQDQSSLVVPMEKPLMYDRVYKQLEMKSYY